MMSDATAPQQLTCPKCKGITNDAEATAHQYRCLHCGYELAHVDTTSTGNVRGIFGWLKQVGEIIGGRYTVKTVLGKGGFGATYLVEDQRVNSKRWALKEIPELLFDEYEVSLLSGLDHPAIPIIVDRFTENGMVYLVLKFGGTRTLQSVCREHGPIPYAKLKPWALQLGNVLEYLHNRKPPIIHRDLKPENVLLDDNDRVMLIDFGIAKESEPNTMTRTLGRAASHGFSPPEQVLGTGTDQRSDIYAYAATLYFALAGRTPAPAHERIAGKTLTPVGQMAPDIPATVDAALARALNLNINERQQHIKELLAVLEEQVQPAAEALLGDKTIRVGDVAFGPLMSGPRSMPRSQPLTGEALLDQMPTTHTRAKAPSHWMIWGAAAAVLIAAIAAGVYYFSRQEKEVAVPQALAPPSPATTDAPTDMMPAPTAATPPQPAAATTASPPAAAPQAPATSAPASGSASDILNARRQASEAEPEAPVQSRMSGVPSSRRAESIVSGSTGVSRSSTPRPAPARQNQQDDGGGWSIVPGQSQKIR